MLILPWSKDMIVYAKTQMVRTFSNLFIRYNSVGLLLIKCRVWLIQNGLNIIFEIYFINYRGRVCKDLIESRI